MRPIDADYVKSKLNKAALGGHLHYYVCGVIDDAPTIDVELVKHGHWIDKTTWFGGIGKCKYECSNCGYTIDYDPKSRGDKRGGNYCDDCGAKMDGGADE